MQVRKVINSDILLNVIENVKQVSPLNYEKKSQILMELLIGLELADHTKQDLSSKVLELFGEVPFESSFYRVYKTSKLSDVSNLAFEVIELSDKETEKIKRKYNILNSKNIFGNLILALAVEQGYINCFSIEEFYQKFYNDGEELEEPVPLDFLEVLSKLKEQLDVKSFINKNEVTEYNKRSFNDYKVTKNLLLCLFNAIENRIIVFKKSEISKIKSLLLDLISALYPEIQIINTEVYKYQLNDYKIDNDLLSLITLNEYRGELIKSLVTLFGNVGYVEIASHLYMKYSSQYNISPLTLYYSVVDSVTRIYNYRVNNKQAKIKNEPTKNTLIYLCKVINSYVNKNSQELRLFIFDKLLKLYINSIMEFNIPKCYIELLNYNVNAEILESKLFQNVKDCLMKNNDSWMQENYLVNNQEARFYLSMIIRGYGDLLLDSNKTFSIQGFIKVLEDYINLYSIVEISKIINLKTFSEKEKKELVIDFFKSMELCKEYDGYLNYDYSEIDYEEIYRSIEKNSTITQYIASAQYNINNHIKTLDYLGMDTNNDWTSLIVVQVKAMEQLLKEVIAQNCVGKRISTRYQFERRNNNIFHRETGDTFNIPNGANFYTLSKNIKRNSRYISVSLELATAQYIIYHEYPELCFKHNSFEERKYFNHENEELCSLNKWISLVRNGYFHTHPIESLDKALEIHNKTAFTFVNCVKNLKRLQR